MTSPSSSATTLPASRSAIQTDRLAFCAVGLALCLMLTGVFDTMFSGQVDVTSFPLRISESPLSGGIGIVAAAALIALVAFVGARRGQGACLLAPSVAKTAALVLALTVPLALLFLENAGLVPAAVGEVGGLALSASSTTLLALWAATLAREGRALAFVAFAAGLVADTLIDVVATNALVPAALSGLILLAGIASPCMLHVLAIWQHAPRSEARPGSDVPDASGVRVAPSPSAPLSHPALSDSTSSPAGAVEHARATASPAIVLALSVACVALYGFAMGRVQSLDSSTFGTTDFASLVSNNVTSIGALIVAVLALAVGRLRHPHTTLRLLILAGLVATLYLSGIFGVAIEPGGVVMMTISRLAVFLYIWLLACDAAAADPTGLRSAGVLAAGWGAFTLLNTVSTRIGIAALTSDAGLVVHTTLTMACIVALIALEFVPRRLVGDGHAAAADDIADAVGAAGASGTPEAPANAEELLAETCRILAERYGLTARELEVLVPLVRGRSASSIGAALSMSTETARTHIRHIYQKTDIHSRDELMDIVDGLSRR